MPESGDDIYVGYLPVPRGERRFLGRWLPGLLAGGAVLAVIVAGLQSDPGDGAWDTTTVREFEGQLYAAPYAMLRVAGSPSDAGEILLLVSEGKFGAAERASGLDGRRVRVRGHLLQRDGRRLLELVADADAVTPIDAGSALTDREGPPPRRPREVGRVTLRGEIIDPKCYFGAMKPGAGKTHKACATLCISGGIPPMLRTVNAAGQPRYYLLTDSAGQAICAPLLPYVADPIEISGVAERLDDLLLLRVDPAGIRRL